MRPWYKYVIRENITEIHVTIKGTLLDRWEGGIFEGEEGIITSILQPKTPRIFNKASLNAFALIRFLRREPEYHPEEIGIAFDYLQPILPEKDGEGVKVFFKCGEVAEGDFSFENDSPNLGLEYGEGVGESCADDLLNRDR